MPTTPAKLPTVVGNYGRAFDPRRRLRPRIPTAAGNYRRALDQH
ncbi:hypothetical protein OG604_10665 [Streptomyces sp. NBC_01231]|nr:hypothetical protein OG604_10665 [Streptomyces sp. NBC_01231]